MSAEKPTGVIIDEFLQRNGISKKRAATILGVSRPTVIYWSHGGTPSPENMGKVYEVFGEKFSETEQDQLADSFGARLAEIEALANDPESIEKRASKIRGRKVSSETRERMSAAQKLESQLFPERFKRSPITRERMSAARNAYLANKKLSQNT